MKQVESEKFAADLVEKVENQVNQLTGNAREAVNSVAPAPGKKTFGSITTTDAQGNEQVINLTKPPIVVTNEDLRRYGLLP